MRKKTILLAMILCVMVIANVALSMVEYTITDLGTLGGDSSTAYGINDNGQVVGQSRIGGDMHGFLYDDGMMTDLVTLGGDILRPKGINNSGQVAGYSQIIGGSEPHAFLYNGTSLTDLVLKPA